MPGGSRRNSALVSAGILLSRVAGLVRERAIAYFLGLSGAANAFAAAFQIPNVLQSLLGEGVLSASFIPVHVRLLDQGRPDEARRLAGTVLGLVAVLAGGAAVLIILAAEPIVAVVARGFVGPERELLVRLLRIIAPATATLIVSAWCLGILNSHRRFFLSYVAPVVFNLAQVVVLAIAGVVLLGDVLAPEAASSDTLARLAVALAWGTLLGGVLQVAIQVPLVLRLAPGVRPWFGPRTPELGEVLRAFVPVVSGRGVVQLLVLVELLLASLLAGAALAVLTKSRALSVLPISLFGMSVAAAELPEVSGRVAVDPRALAERLDAGLARIAFYVLPTVVGFVVLGELLVGALFGTGAYGAAEVRVTAIVLLGSAVGLAASTGARLLQSVLYGAGQARAPAVLAAVRVVIAATLGGLLMLQLDRFVLVEGSVQLLDGASLPALSPLPPEVRASDDLPHLGALGLTLATGVSAWIEFRLLRELVELRTSRPVRVGGAERRPILLATAAAAVTAVVARFAVAPLPVIPGALVAVAAVAVVHIAVADRLGVREARSLTRLARLRRR